MHFNRLTILVPIFIVLASATAFAVHFDLLSNGPQGFSFNILHALAEGDGGGGGGGGGDGGGGYGGGGCCDDDGDAGGDTGGDAGSGEDVPPPPPPPAPAPTFTLSITKTELSPGDGVTARPGDRNPHR